jgi:hypothetical protein
MKQELVDGLIERWMEDADFRAAVRANPEGAIRAAGLELSDAEWAAVRNFDWSTSDEELLARVSKGGGLMPMWFSGLSG